VKGRDVDVRLSWSEVRLASVIGVARRIASLAKGLTDVNGEVSNPWGVDIEGACYELAVCKLMGWWWPATVNTGKAPDVNGHQVRGTTCLGGRLILRGHDDPQAAYIFVVGSAPNYQVVGWELGVRVMRDEFKDAPAGRRTAWFVPRSALRPMTEIEQGGNDGQA